MKTRTLVFAGIILAILVVAGVAWKINDDRNYEAMKETLRQDQELFDKSLESNQEAFEQQLRDIKAGVR